MVPSAFVFLDGMPLTPNGKVDRRALPEPGSNGQAGSRKRPRPRTILELDLARIWQDLFQRDAIGLDDNFFELGRSLAARCAAGLGNRAIDRSAFADRGLVSSPHDRFARTDAQ